jgi:hypothetical protein
MNSEIKLGKYKHFKGHTVEVVGVAKHSEDYNQELVVYSHPDKNGNEQLWARPVEMFLENVEKDDYKGPRFEYIGK